MEVGNTDVEGDEELALAIKVAALIEKQFDGFSLLVAASR